MQHIFKEVVWRLSAQELSRRDEYRGIRRNSVGLRNRVNAMLLYELGEVLKKETSGVFFCFIHPNWIEPFEN